MSTPAENRAKWTAALRSGKYDQTTGQLRDWDGFCCLGVACDVYRRETGDGEWDGAVFVSRHDRGFALLTEDVQRWLGLESSSGRSVMAGEDEMDLTALNDDRGFSFSDIADLIDSGAVVTVA